MKLADWGCEIARVTVQGIKEAEACEHIKNGLLQRGYTIPLVADIHFYPPAAMKVVDFVDKVRVNPGNFVDKRASFKIIEYDDASYAEEIEKIEEKFTPLVEKCKRLKRAMRIGTNHGSLSDRIMNRYGDSPKGMVESAFEFARICIKNDYHDFMFSMKSSNPQVMIQAYRLLVAEMLAIGWDYPLHLGVTEAGLGEDGRIKSAMGIGSLLLDGIGDTIRVSLTEDPWYEIDSCIRLKNFAESYIDKGVEPFTETFRQFQNIKRRSIHPPKNVSLHRDGTVIVSASDKDVAHPDFYRHLGCDVQFGQPRLKVSTADNIVIQEAGSSRESHKILSPLKQIGVGIVVGSKGPQNIQTMRLLDLKEAIFETQMKSKTERFAVRLSKEEALPLAVRITQESSMDWEGLLSLHPSIIILSPLDNRLHYSRRFFEWLQESKLQVPVILNFSYSCSKEDLIIQSGAEYGALLCDGLGEGVWIDAPFTMEFLRNLSFNILQAARMRSSKTDFISCPSCGRTLFDLQDVTSRIKSRTAHLPGVKIAIMGCIVNGPGEMADADFGYVGSKPGMIDLYVGKTCIEKDIPFDKADDRLISLIQDHNRWQDPE
jgi:(E)-4-hydroxy-3-methylbut-2-enyl-diphosphate synthase